MDGKLLKIKIQEGMDVEIMQWGKNRSSEGFQEMSRSKICLSVSALVEKMLQMFQCLIKHHFITLSGTCIRGNEKDQQFFYCCLSNGLK